jgi:hypothetical protein
VALTALPSAGSKLRASVLQSLITELRPLTARMAALQNLTASSTTFQNITDLALAVEASVTYEGTLIIGASVASGTTEDIKVALTYPTGCSLYTWSYDLPTSATTSTNAVEFIVRQAFASGSAILAAGLTTTISWFEVKFELTTSTTAGTLQVQAAQNTSGGNVVTVATRSRMILQRTD